MLAITAMCDLTLRLSAMCVMPDLIHVGASTRSLADACEVKDVFPSLALKLIRPFLSQMIVIFLDHRETGVAKIVGRFQAGNPDKRKCQRFLRIGDGRRRHLWLVLR